eukprot:COSAG01_NODE_6957_length_3417_cov_9.172393_3_plen_78_part_00
MEETVEHAFLRALKRCANGVIVFPILGHLSTRTGDILACFYRGSAVHHRGLVLMVLGLYCGEQSGLLPALDQGAGAY